MRYSRLLIASISLWVAMIVPILSAPSRAIAQATTATIEFLDIGQGDAVLIRSSEGKTALVDAGPSDRIVKLLEDRGIVHLDLIVVSHHHSDHYGGMDAVIKKIKPKTFLASDSAHTTPNYLKILKLVKDQGMTVITPTNQSRKITLGSIDLIIFPQPPEDGDEENNNSVGIRLQHGKIALLLTGDSEDSERSWWLANAKELLEDCQLLKLAHHGSRNGTDEKWLRLVRPEQCVASCAAGNSYGHPHAETISLLQRLRIPLSRTDEDGSVTVTSDGEHWAFASGAVALRGPPAVSAAAPAPAATAILLDVNTSTSDQLRTLPGIGPALAQKIVEGRPYRALADLLLVDGIGLERLKKIRPFIKVK